METMIRIGDIPLIYKGKDKTGLSYYELAEDHIDDDFPGIVVPKGFLTNGASVPKYIRGIISPTGNLFRAAVVHDYLYATHQLSRRKSDRVFKKIVYDDTQNRLLAYTSYLGIRAVGSSFWNADTKPVLSGLPA